MRVLFYEPVCRGHHFAYLARMLPGFIHLPIEIGLATSPEAIDSQEFEALIAPLQNKIEVIPSCRDPLQKMPLRNTRRRVADLKQSIKQWQPDHLCVAYADGIWQLLAAEMLRPGANPLGGVVAEGWMFRGKFSYPAAKQVSHSAKRWLWKRMLRAGLFSKIHLHDELLCEFSNAVPQDKTEVALVADPIDVQASPSQAVSRHELGVPAEGFIFSCLGMANERKGVYLAMDAIAKLLEDKTAAPAIRLLIAGPHSDELKARLAQPPFRSLMQSGNIVSIDRFLDEREMRLSAVASNVVLAPYPNHSGRSSIILWAAAAGVPVLAVDSGCIRYVIEHENLGITCNVHDATAFAQAMRSALDQRWTEQDADRVSKYANWHRVENYQAMCSKLVRERLAYQGVEG